MRWRGAPKIYNFSPDIGHDTFYLSFGLEKIQLIRVLIIHNILISRFILLAEFSQAKRTTTAVW